MLSRKYYGNNSGVSRIAKYNGFHEETQLIAGKVVMSPDFPVMRPSTCGYPMEKSSGRVEVFVMYDTIIIGGGIAGLQTAIQLARSLRRVVVVDHHGGRSSVARAYRNLLGYPDGIGGESLRQTGRRQAAHYGATFIEEEVVALKPDGKGGFLVTTKNGREPLRGRTLVMATGIRDPFPAIAGVRDCLGLSVFLCPDCDGYETVGEPTAVIGAGPHAVDMAEELSYYSRQLVVVNHAGIPTDAARRQWMDKRGFAFFDTQVGHLLHEGGQLRGLVLATGETLPVSRAFLAFPGAKVETDLLRGFAVRLNEKGHVLTNPRTKETDHPNVWAVGDIAEHSQQVAIAMGDGAQAAIWIQKRLREEDA